MLQKNHQGWGRHNRDARAAADRLDAAMREALEAGCGVLWTTDQVAVSPNALQKIRRRGRPARWGMPMPGRGGPGPRPQRHARPGGRMASRMEAAERAG